MWELIWLSLFFLMVFQAVPDEEPLSHPVLPSSDAPSPFRLYRVLPETVNRNTHLLLPGGKEQTHKHVHVFNHEDIMRLRWFVLPLKIFASCVNMRQIFLPSCPVFFICTTRCSVACVFALNVKKQYLHLQHEHTCTCPFLDRLPPTER